MGSRIALVVLVLTLLATRPPSREAPPGTGEEAALLRQLSMSRVEFAAYDRQRSYDEGFRHWAEVYGPREQTPRVSEGEGPPPALAGLVGLASALGIREVAALGVFVLADRADATGDFTLMRLYLHASTELDPRFLAPASILGYIYRRREPARARQVLSRALEANPDSWELWNDLAWIALRPGPNVPPDLDEAARLLRGATTNRHPYHVRRLLALVEDARGDREASREALHSMLGPDIDRVNRQAAERLLEGLESGVNPLRKRLGLAPR